MPDTIERASCPTCARPIYRYVTVRIPKAPAEAEVSRTWWFHDDDSRTYACEQGAVADG